MNASLHVNQKKKCLFTKMNFKGTLPWDELSRLKIKFIEDRKVEREKNPQKVPPEYAYTAKQEDKYEHNDSRGGIRSDDDDYMSPDDMKDLTNDLLKRFYNIAMEDDRRNRRNEAQREMNSALVIMMDKIYSGYSEHVKESNGNRQSSSDEESRNIVDWKTRADQCKLIDLAKIS